MQHKKMSFTKKKNTVSIGIPAFNEEANIGDLLKSLLDQKQHGFVLKEIIVVSDKSEDKTDEIVRSFKDKKIHLIVNKKRLGQSPGQEKIIRQFSGDILVLLNADVMPGNDNFLGELIKPLLKDQKISLTSPQLIPLKPNTLFERIIFFSNEFKESMVDKIDSGNNVLHCHGRARAFSRNFAKSIKWPTSVGEDAFTYFKCVSSNYGFKYQPKALVYYRSPDNFRDHQKQSARFLKSQEIMSKIFGDELVINSYAIPPAIKIKSSIEYFLKNPMLFISYIFVFLFISKTMKGDQYEKSIWEVSKSSKILSNNAA